MKKARAWVALVLTFALVTGLAAPAYASAETKGSVTIQQETADAAQGVYKLVVKAQSSVAVTTAAIAISFDQNVVQPMSYQSSTGTYIAAEGISDGNTSVVDTFAQSCAFVSPNTPYFSRTAAKWAVGENRVAFALTMKSTDDSNGT